MSDKPGRMNTYMKYRAICCMAAISCAVLAGCSGDSKKTEIPELLEPVGRVADTCVVTKSDISNTRILDAQAIPATEELSFETDGYVAQINVKLGDSVKKGDVLAVLDGAGEGNEYDQIIRQIDQNKTTYSEENLVAEYDIKIMQTEKNQLNKKYKEASGDEKKELKKQIAVKQADIDIAKESLKGKKEIQSIELSELERKKKVAYNNVQQYYLKAPMDGQITYISLTPSQNVASGEFVMALSDMNTVRIKSDFISKHTLNMAEEYYVVYKNKHYGLKQQEYDPEEIEGLLAEEKVPYSFYDITESEVDFPIGESLDMYVISDKATEALVIPSNALYKEQSTYYVYKKSGETKVKTEVTVGTITTAMVQIVDGVKEGDVLYVKE